MIDPKRLSLDCESDLEGILLRAGRAKAPSVAKERALLAVSASVAMASLTAGGAVAGHAGAAAKVGSIVILKWLSILAMVGAGAVASAVAVRNSHRDSAAPRLQVTQPAGKVAEASPSVVAPPTIPTTAAGEAFVLAPSIAASTPNPRSVARSSPRPAEPSAMSASALPAELAMLDRARDAVRTGEMTRALSVLDAYAARFPRGAMAPEAAVLRVEALVKSGNRPAAVRFANAFLASAPRSPYATRIQSMLAASNP